MPYSSAWDVTRPAGTVAAKNIDDEIRILRLQLQERMNDVLVVDMAADPLVLKDTVNGLKTGLQRIIPFSAFLSDLHARENDINLTGYLKGFVGNDMAAPLFLPIGCVITKLEWLIDKGDATSVTGKLYSRPFANTAPAFTIVNTTAITAAGANIVPSVDIAVTMVPDVMYWIGIIGLGTLGASYTVYGCRITFNRPSIASAT